MLTEALAVTRAVVVHIDVHKGNRHTVHKLAVGHAENYRLEPLGAQLVEQRLGLFQVGSVEALGEPAVDVGEHRARFVTAILRRKQPREAHGCAQF